MLKAEHFMVEIHPRNIWLLRDHIQHTHLPTGREREVVGEREQCLVLTQHKQGFTISQSAHKTEGKNDRKDLSINNTKTWAWPALILMFWPACPPHCYLCNWKIKNHISTHICCSWLVSVCDLSVLGRLLTFEWKHKMIYVTNGF